MRTGIMLGSMKVAIGQIRSSVDKLGNLARVCTLAATAAKQGARLIVFPEATMQAFGTGRLDKAAEPLDGDFVTTIADCAQHQNIAIIAGIFRPADFIRRSDKQINRITNTAIAALPTGETYHYDKIHTYDAFGYRESDTVKPGEKLVVFDYADTKIGLAICYDLRFPELFRQLAARGAQVIVVPISWAGGADKLRQKHLLSQARALDSTSWLIAADQAETALSGNAPRGVGHSTITTPDGRIAAEAGPEEELLLFDIDIADVARVREKLPIVEYAHDYSNK